MVSREIEIFVPRICAGLLSALCLTCAALAQDAAPRIAGSIDFTDGDVLLESKDGKTRPPVVAENVLEGDTVTTFTKGEIQLHMADGASLIVRENSKITIAAYVADGGDKDRSLIDLAKGALRSITGWIGQYNRANYKIRTPLVTIGVRGTDHEPTHLLPGDPRGDPGSYDKVNEGSAFMQTKQGIVEVPRNRAVFHSAAARTAPRLLASVPAFFRPGRHEQRFLARARDVRKAMPQRWLERREFIRQRGAVGGARPVREKLRDAGRGGRVKPAARAPKEARTSERPKRPQAGDRPQRARRAKGPRAGGRRR